ncbi:lysophospholipid acyltransferase family protein [Planctomicrobium sp. SH668]|uniref:lysophospholipid acyltransferase family protein n=1 Tax=Planctomicrobium sp. SH668 TaxID=3448126 RepID=UPI003F5CA464
MAKPVTISQQIQWRIEYFIFRSFGCVVEILSPRQVNRLAHFLAWVTHFLVPRKLTRYELSRENLSHAFNGEKTSEEIDKLIYGMWVHLFRLVCEIIQFPRKLRLENCREVMRFYNRAVCVQAINSGRPVYFVGGHYGNWEASTATFGVFGVQMGVIARKLDNPYLQTWFRSAREQTGHLLLLKSGGWDGMGELMQLGGSMALMCDQDAGRRGLFVDFMGRPASTYKSIALMALETKGLIVVGYGRRVEDDFDEGRWARFEVGCEEVIDAANIDADDEVREVTERFSRALERAIMKSPEQYFWLHRRWKSVPNQKRKSKMKEAS